MSPRRLAAWTGQEVAMRTLVLSLVLVIGTQWFLLARWAYDRLDAPTVVAARQ